MSALRALQQAHATTEPPATSPSNAPAMNVAVVKAEVISMPMDIPPRMIPNTQFDNPDEL